jgi:hypothetical protein
MANKKFWPGMLVTALVFGTALIGCDNGTSSGSVGSGEAAGITYTVEADGKVDKETSTQLTFTFDAAVSLKDGDIHINEGTGKAAKNTSIRENLTGSGTSWTLSITRVTAGKIRVKIDKDGIERSRKTVLVHQNTSSALTKEDAITLSAGQWEDGSITYGETKWYKFEAAAGKDYRIQWKNLWYKYAGEDYTAGIRKVTSYQSDGTTIISNNWEDDLADGYTRPKPLSGVSGTVYLKVEIHQIDKTLEGTFAVRFYDQASMPQVTIMVNYPRATVAPSVVVKWNVQSLSYNGGKEDTAAKNTVNGFRVFRSNTESGTYTQIGDFTFTEFRVILYPSSDADRVIYCDKDVTVGKTYWYKVTAYNSTGETDMSEPRESEVVPAPTSIPLTIGGAQTSGELIKAESRDETDKLAAWYSFEATSEKTYRVQWNSYEDNDKVLSRYGWIWVSAFTAEKELINFQPVYDSGSEKGWTAPGTVSGVSGTVYLKVNLKYLRNPNGPGGYLDGPYTIKVSEEK